MSSGKSEVEELLAEVQAEEAAGLGEGQEESASDVGPEVETVDDPVAGDEDDDLDEGELSDGDDDEGQEDDEELAGESEEEELEGDEESEEANSEEPNPLQGRLDQVEQELRFLRQAREQERRQAQARQQQPRPPAVNPEVKEATRIALFGGTTADEQLAGFSPEVRRLGIERAREANEMAVLQTTDPDAYYHKYLGPMVDAHIRVATKEFREVNQRTSEDAVVKQHSVYLARPGARDRVEAILVTLPRGGSFEKRLALAVELDVARSGSVGRAKKTQSEKARTRDEAAKGTAKRRRGRGRRRSGGRKKAPVHDMDNVMEDVAYLQEQERLGLLEEE